MALVVEDGTGVAGADSYADLATLRAYAARRGVTLSADDATLEPFAYKAMDYLDDYGVGLGVLVWPASPTTLCGQDPITALDRLVNLQAQLCIEQHNGVDLAPAPIAVTSAGGAIIEETVGPITTKYSASSVSTVDNVDANGRPIIPSIAARLLWFSCLLPRGRFNVEFRRV